MPRLTRRAYVESLRKGLELPKKAVWAATLVAAGLVLTLALRAVLRSPLNVDEELTLRIAREAFGSIFGTVRGRGGGPFHFWLEHVTLADLAKGALPGDVDELTEQSGAWHRR